MANKKEKKILGALSSNSRMPLKSLAKRAGVSPSSALYTLRKLEEENIIIGYHPIIDNTRLGFIGFRSYISFQGTIPEEEEEIAAWLRDQPEVAVLGLAGGEKNLVIMSWVEHTSQYHDFLQRLKERHLQKLSRIETFSYVRTHYFGRRYLDDYEVPVLSTGGERVEVDELDMSILNSLLDNARKPSLQIAKEIKTPARTVAQRLKGLEKNGIIVGYGLNVDVSKLGYSFFKIDILLNKGLPYAALLEFSRQLKSTIYVDETLGELDFELNVEVANQAELQDVVDRLKIFTGGFRRFQIYQIKKFLKLNYISQV